MTKPNLRFMRNDHIEDVTAQRIREYERKAGRTIRFPVPAEEIGEYGEAREAIGYFDGVDNPDADAEAKGQYCRIAEETLVAIINLIDGGLP